MHANRLLVSGLVRGALVVAAGLALVLGGAVQPAAATSSVPPPVALGAHRFGHLRAPDSIVAHADADEVGFSQPPEGADGVAFGPWSFDVAQDGSIWLLDEVKHRLLVWPAGRPDHPARSVRLPQDPLERVADFAVAPDHSIYATYVPPPGPGPKTLRLAKLTRDGRGPLDGPDHRRDLQRPAAHRPRRQPVRLRWSHRHPRLDAADHPGRTAAVPGRPAAGDQRSAASPGRVAAGCRLPLHQRAALLTQR
jgi:hypothetical protein